MEITKNTRVSAILEEYGDIADVMEVFGIHHVPLAEFLDILYQATKNNTQP